MSHASDKNCFEGFVKERLVDLRHDVLIPANDTGVKQIPKPASMALPDSLVNVGPEDFVTIWNSRGEVNYGKIAEYGYTDSEKFKHYFKLDSGKLTYYNHTVLAIKGKWPEWYNPRKGNKFTLIFKNHLKSNEEVILLNADNEGNLYYKSKLGRIDRIDQREVLWGFRSLEGTFWEKNSKNIKELKRSYEKDRALLIERLKTNLDEPWENKYDALRNLVKEYNGKFSWTYSQHSKKQKGTKKLVSPPVELIDAEEEMLQLNQLYQELSVLRSKSIEEKKLALLKAEEEVAALEKRLQQIERERREIEFREIEEMEEAFQEAEKVYAETQRNNIKFERRFIGGLVGISVTAGATHYILAYNNSNLCNMDSQKGPQVEIQFKNGFVLKLKKTKKGCQIVGKGKECSRLVVKNNDELECSGENEESPSSIAIPF